MHPIVALQCTTDAKIPVIWTGMIILTFAGWAEREVTGPTLRPAPVFLSQTMEMTPGTV
jgi:hypothetical protein